MNTQDGVSALAAATPIGQPRPRPATRRLLAGHGRYVDDITLPGMQHLAFVRSPHAKAGIQNIDVTPALSMPGVAGAWTGRDLAQVCQGWHGGGLTYVGFAPPMQHAMAIDAVAYHGEAVAVVAAQSRAQAEDAAERIHITWDMQTASSGLDALSGVPDQPDGQRPGTSYHTHLGNAEAVRQLQDQAAFLIDETFRFARQTGMPLETRSIIADFAPGEDSLTLHHSHQVPHEMQALFSALLSIPQHRLRIICPDVGGGFGVKLHLYADELATAAVSLLLRRPVKYIADRHEAMLTDIHAREHIVQARLSVDAQGRLLGLDIDDLFGMGAYSTAPRTSLSEAILALRCMGAPYDMQGFHARLDAVLQNRAPTGQYRAVGMPIGSVVTERLLDLAGQATGLGPVEIRRRNFIDLSSGRAVTQAGMPMFDLSHQACLEKILTLSDWERRTQERDSLRRQGIYRGMGLAVFVEPTGPSSDINGRAGVTVIAMDSATVKLEPSGTVRCLTSTSDQGQGTSAGIAQIVAAGIGLPIEDVHVAWGDTAAVPPGGGAWASRGILVGGEAAWIAARELRAQLLRLAAALHDKDDAALDIAQGQIIDTRTGQPCCSLQALAETAYYRYYEIPDGLDPQLAVTRQYRRQQDPFVPANGIQASYVEVDVETGCIRLLGHWVAEDCGRLINPLLADEQIRGGVVQGLGPALFEACHYTTAGESLVKGMGDYFTPTAVDIPDIRIAHVETPYRGTRLGAKGVGEGGTCGAAAAVLNAVNDALSPFRARVATLPMTPAVILQALDDAESTRDAAA